MNFIRSQMPTLDAALLRFDSWWEARAPRERMLIGVLGALAALVVVVFGVVKPLQAARAQALADIRTYEMLSARIRAAGTLTTAKAPRRVGAPEKVANDAAAAFGLAVTAEPIAGGARVTVADATYDSVLAWLADLAGTSDLRVRRLSIVRRPAAGRVSASVDLGA
ncbi:type II secretion system protein GspM [Sphingomonas sp. CJ20]